MLVTLHDYGDVLIWTTKKGVAGGEGCVAPTFHVWTSTVTLNSINFFTKEADDAAIVLLAVRNSRSDCSSDYVGKFKKSYRFWLLGVFLLRTEGATHDPTFLISNDTSTHHQTSHSQAFTFGYNTFIIVSNTIIRWPNPYLKPGSRNSIHQYTVHVSARWGLQRSEMDSQVQASWPFVILWKATS